MCFRFDKMILNKTMIFDRICQNSATYCAACRLTPLVRKCKQNQCQVKRSRSRPKRSKEFHTITAWVQEFETYEECEQVSKDNKGFLRISWLLKNCFTGRQINENKYQCQKWRSSELNMKIEKSSKPFSRGFKKEVSFFCTYYVDVNL